MQSKCTVENRLIKPCQTLSEVTSDYQGHYKKGMSIMPLTQLIDKDFVHTKDYLIVKNGQYAKKGIVCNFCPFCGEKVYED